MRITWFNPPAFADFIYFCSLTSNDFVVLYKRNVQFTRLIKINGQLKEFNFRKPTVESKTYHVDVGDERGNRHIWSMEAENGNWKIKPTLLPDWILDAEPLLAGVIQEEESRLGVV